jgi:hypothetical protein
LYESPIKNPILALNGTGRGIVNNLVIPSEAASSYAPRGRSLVSVILIGHHEKKDVALDQEVRQELKEWFGNKVGDWRLLRVYRLNKALPDQRPPIHTPSRQNVEHESGVLICGEYRFPSSIHWAMVSGRYAAESAIGRIQKRQ